MTFFRPATVFSRPTSSGMLLRNPEKVITEGKPASAQASTDLRISAMHISWLALSLNPSTNPWLGARALIRPYFFSVGQSWGLTSSTDLMPMATESWQSRSSVIGLTEALMKHQSATDWLMRPLVTARRLDAVVVDVFRRRLARPNRGSAAPTATAPAARFISPRRVRPSAAAFSL